MLLQDMTSLINKDGTQGYFVLTNPPGVRYTIFFHYSKHPYLFFNQDHHTMTFLGFSILPNGDLIDHETNEIIERDLMSKELYTDLQTYGALSCEECDVQEALSSEDNDEQDKYV